MRRDLELGVAHHANIPCMNHFYAILSPHRRRRQIGESRSARPYHPPAGMRSGSACAWCAVWRPPTPRGSWPSAPTNPSHRLTTCGGDRACRSPRWLSWPRPTPSCRLSVSSDGMRSGRSRRCAASPFRSSLPPPIARIIPEKLSAWEDKLAQQRSLIQVLQIEERRMVTENAVLLKRILEAETDG